MNSTVVMPVREKYCMKIFCKTTIRKEQLRFVSVKWHTKAYTLNHKNLSYFTPTAAIGLTAFDGCFSFQRLLFGDEGYTTWLFDVTQMSRKNKTAKFALTCAKKKGLLKRP